MGSAFTYIEYDNRYDDPPEVIVIYDDAEVLMYDVHDGGCFDLFEWCEPEEVRSGYYQIEYNYDIETESYEMPHIRYPVIVALSIEKFTFMGHIKHLFFILFYFITRTNKYTIGRS